MKDCKECGISFKPKYGSKGLFCSAKCSADNRYTEYINRWLDGKEAGCGGKTLDLSHYIIRFLRTTRGSACEECGWDKLHPVDNRPLTEIDHTDGDASNCRPENLKILCPNCHAMTPTFRARNKNSARKR